MNPASFADFARSAGREAGALFPIDAGTSTTVLKAKPLRARRLRIESTRHVVQAGFLLTIVGIGWQFARFVHGLEVGRVVATRPPGVEAFLPIAALLSLRHWFVTGEVHPVHPAGMAILLLAMALSLLAKRAFCSWVCPVGTISEALAALSLRLFRRKLKLPRFIDLPLRSLKYLLLAFFVYVVFFQMGPAVVAGFLDSAYNRVADVKMLYFFEQIGPFGLKVLLTLVGLSIVIPYFWCRYLCPYGALLGALSLLSPLKVTRHAPSCIDCNLCTKACPSHLPVARLARVRSDECFGCLSCVAACPVPRALRVETPAPWRRAVRPAAFAGLVLLFFVGGTLLARALGVWQNSITVEEYEHRIRAIDSPEYTHAGGSVSDRPE
ncbi:MAG: 4Fe-4S binding protein [Vicinamibacteria bacterium]